MKPKLGKRYTRRQIATMFGGDVVSYLPNRDGVVLSGCFKREPEWNPGAPDEVVFGPGPKVLRSAEILAGQDQAIPVFIFRGSAAWEYVGDYQCTGLRTESDTCRSAERRNPDRGKICGLLRFKRVS
jgi:hypothetical protein